MHLAEGRTAGDNTGFEAVIDIPDNCKPAASPGPSPQATSSGSPSRNNMSLETRRYTDNLTEEEKQNLDFLDQALDKNENSTAKIQKVPSILRNNGFDDYYVPKKVSIGPYHRKNENPKVSENLKVKFAKLFIRNNGLDRFELYSKIKRRIQNLKEYYEAEAIEGFNDNELAWMFLVDGCTVLCYIYYAMRENEKKLAADLRVKDRLILLKQDLLLLENQLPYDVLRLIMSCLNDRKASDDMKRAIDEFIFERIQAPEEKYVAQLDYQDEDKEDKKLIHLLDLVRKRLLHPAAEHHESFSKVRKLLNNAGKRISNPLDTIKDFIEYIGKAFEKSSHDRERKNVHFFRNIEELTAVGIRLKTSKTSHLKSITFHLGTLKLPWIRIDEATISKFLNLIAYEMCPNSDDGFGICSFVVFLDAFIDQAQDVKKLRDKQILHNALGSDEEVAKLFNVISNHLISNPNEYKEVKTAIQQRYENKPVTWVAQLKHQHFKSPWTLIAFLAAVIAITSSVVQTTYTILGFYAGR